MNRTDQNLKDAIAANERKALWSASAVIFGLVLEVIFAAAFREPPETILNHWGPVVADALVALGVAGEVLFGRKSRIDSEELNRRSEERLAEAQAQAGEANARAAEADLARARLEEKLAPRQLSLAQRNELIDSLKQFSGMVAHFWVNPTGTTDTFELGIVLANLALAAGWETSSWLLQSGIPSPAPGVIVTWRDGSAANKEAAEVFADTLQHAGIYAVAPIAFPEHETTLEPEGQPAMRFMSGRPIRLPTIRIFVATKPQ